MEKKEKDFTGIILTMFFALLVCDIYFMVEFGNLYGLIGGISAIEVVLFYCSFNSIYSKIKKNIDMKSEQYDYHIKSQKAICLLQKSLNEKFEKSFDEIKEELVEELVQELNEINEKRSADNKMLVKAALVSVNKKFDELKGSIHTIEMRIENIENIKDEKDETYNLAFDIAKLREDVVAAIIKMTETLSEQISNIEINYVEKNDVKLEKEDEEDEMEDIITGSDIEEKDVEIKEGPVVEEEAGVEEEPVVQEEAVAEVEPEIDLSNPNRELSADEIAALFANAGKEEDATEEEKVREEEPEIDLSNPNRELSADEIAALFANAGKEEDATEEEKVREEEPEIDLSNPNRELSADEIAALFASMGS